jgi:hypothetical protein
MFSFPDVIHLFAHEFPSLGAGRFALLGVLAGSFNGSFLRHWFSFRTQPE